MAVAQGARTRCDSLPGQGEHDSGNQEMRKERGLGEGKNGHPRIRVCEREEKQSEYGPEWQRTPHLLSDVGSYSREEFPPQCP